MDIMPPWWWNSWWLEPLVATVAFAVWIHLYWYMERKHGLSTTTNVWKTFHFFRLDQDRSGNGGVDVGGGCGPLMNSLVAYWVGIYVFQSILTVIPIHIQTITDSWSWFGDFISWFQWLSLSTSSLSSSTLPFRPIIPTGIPSMTRLRILDDTTTGTIVKDEIVITYLFFFLLDCIYLMAEVLSGLIQYDFIMFWIHWMMHDIPILRSWHKRHHQHQQHHQQQHDQQQQQQQQQLDSTNCPSNTHSSSPHHRHCECRDTLNHGLMDGILQVAVNILIQQYSLVGFASWGWRWWCSHRIPQASLFSSSSSPPLPLLGLGPYGLVPKSRLARLLHNIFVTWLLVESHTSSPKPYIWRRWCSGVREHYRHHNNNSHPTVAVVVDDATSSSPLASHLRTTTRDHKTMTPLHPSATTTTDVIPIQRRHQQFFEYLDHWRAHYYNSGGCCVGQEGRNGGCN